MSHNLPRATLDSLNEVLAGYNKTVDVGEKISDEDVSEHREVSEDLTRRQKAFLNELNVLEKEGHDYHLTEDGHELGRMIRFNQMDKAANIYGDLLDEWEPTAEILGHVDDDGLSLEDLSDIVALVTATELDHPRKERGAETVVELLELSGYIVEKNGSYYPVENSEPTQEEESEAQKLSPQNSEASKEANTSVETSLTRDGGIQRVNQAVQTGGVSVSVDISGDDDPENVQELLLAIRRGMQEDIEKNDGKKESE